MTNTRGNPKHGGHGTLTYARWKSMMQRCYVKSASNYRHYGARGIEVAARWHDYANFLADMGPCPSGLTLDRIRGDEGYAPGNCRWATKAEQNQNRPSHRVMLTLDGTTRSVTEWSKALGISANTLNQRRYLGWNDHAVLTTPIKKRSAT